MSQQQRTLATKLYRDGNKLLDESRHEAAARRYREALKHWDHPRIHYNLMLAMIELKRPLEAYKSGVAALRYNGLALKPQKRHQVRRHLQLLRSQIAKVVIHSDVEGAAVTMDGQELFTGPGQKTLLVPAGKHQIVAKQRDHLTTRAALEVWPGEPVNVKIDMLHAENTGLTTRRWAWWKPYAVIGAGVGIGLVGSAFQWRSSANNQKYRAVFSAECEPPAGCMPADYSDELKSHEARFTWYRRVGMSAFAIGGAAAATGVVLWYLNRPDRKSGPPRDNLVQITMTPTITPTSAGASLSMGF